MQTIDVEIPPAVFNAAYFPYLDCMQRFQLFFGGSSSGKSRFVAQRTIKDLLSGGRNYLLIRNTASTIRSSMFAELRQVITDWDVEGLFKVNKSDLTISCINGYQALAKGLDDVEKTKSILPTKGVFTDIWIEEATETKADDLRQLERRLRGVSEAKKRITMTFNPILRTHWIHTRFFDEFLDSDTIYQDDQTFILKTTYRDNRFLAHEDIDTLEGETDTYWRSVYTLGNWGVLGDIIFKNWSVEDIDPVLLAGFDNHRNGLDFGYGSDPFAFIRSHYVPAQATIYITDEMQAKKHTNQMIAQAIQPILGDDLVVCDSAEPKSIQELIIEGITATPATKGKDSVNFGIQWLQQQTIIVSRHCQHIQNELEQYQWQQDKNGDTLPIPIKRNDHGIDGLRYSYERDMLDSSVFNRSKLLQCEM